MRHVFEKVMPQYRIEDCVVVHTRYRPGKHKSCLVSYRLTLRHGERTGSQLLYGRFYSPGNSLSRFLQAQQAPLAAPLFGQPLYHLPDLEGIVWAFPNDRVVRGIPALLDRQRVAGDVVPLLVRAVGLEATIEEVSLELVQYIPEWGCTARVAAHLAGSRAVTFYGKAYKSAEGGEATHRNMLALWNAPQRPAWLGMAQPLSYEPEPRILWRSSVDGVTLASFETTAGPRFLSQFENSGRAVAAFHSIPVPGLKPATLADLCARIGQAAERLELTRPRLALRVSVLRAQLLAGAGGLGTRPAATLHGDLHAKNVVCTGSGIALIDLDDLLAGDPLEDLGSFLASIYGHGFLNKVSTADIASLARAVLRGYERHAPWEVSRPDLGWYTAVALLFEADGAVAYVKACGPRVLLEVARAVLDNRGLPGLMLRSHSAARSRRHDLRQRRGTPRCAPKGTHASREEDER